MNSGLRILDLVTNIMILGVFCCFTNILSNKCLFLYSLLQIMLSRFIFIRLSFQNPTFEYMNLHFCVVKYLSANNIDTSDFFLLQHFSRYLYWPRFRVVGKKDFVYKADNEISKKKFKIENYTSFKLAPLLIEKLASNRTT